MFRVYLFLFLFLFKFTTLCFSQSQPPLLDLWLYPNPGLPKNASNSLFQDSLSLRPFQIHQPKYQENKINQPLSEQFKVWNAKAGTLPPAFSLEFWLLNHVNEPIGLELFFDQKSVLGIWDKSYSIQDKNIRQKQWKGYWTHILISFDSRKLTYYENGAEIEELDLHQIPTEIFLQSYLNQEPYMRLDHWLKHLAIHPVSFNLAEAQTRFLFHQEIRNNGKRLPNSFHFLAEPYLFATDSGMQITFETDRNSTAKVIFGKELPLIEELNVKTISDNIFSLTIPDLQADTPYFYQITAKDEEGNSLESGILTFKTKVKNEAPIVFGVVSDTEARPQINEKIGLRLWDERPDFVIHMGDVTDGGKENDKWQWTQEYFPGSSALTTRIPMIPTAGNGEGDLYWYKKYHPQAEPDGYFSYTSGSGEFFVLNSNNKSELQPGGAQYEWLKSGLSQSKSTWKFVYMHHAPYSSDEDDYGNTWKQASTYGDRDFQPLTRLLEEFGVDVMFFGHLHTYMRTFPLRNDQIDLHQGIHYIQMGGMGGNLEDFAPNRVWFAEKTFRGFHYGIVSLTQEKFTMNVFNTEGAMIDRLEIKK